MKSRFLLLVSALLFPLWSLPAQAQLGGAGADVPLIVGGPNFAASSTVDPQGNVWIGTEDQGVWRCGPDGGAQFSKKNGLTDDTVYSLACDSLGRVWAGQNTGGVSVFNGKTWRNYDATQGAGGSHIFAIATCPSDGDVWLATECGLTRYSLKKDTWSYYDRSTGMPDVQISSLAFDSGGNLFVGLQCDGIAMAGPGDNYAAWRVVTGPDEMPAAAKGDGLPSSLVNAMAVDHDGAIYAGTANGLAYSTDHGQTWKYMRGKDWAILARGSYDGAPQTLTAGRTELTEDWITCLSAAQPGILYVGFRSKGYEALNTPAMQKGSEGVGVVRTLCLSPDGNLIVGTCGRGALRTTLAVNGGAISPPASSGDVPFPTAAPPPTQEELEAMIQKVQSLPAGTSLVQILPDDWSTRGDWVGRYGHELAELPAFQTIRNLPFTVSVVNGPYRTHAYVFEFQQGVNATRNNLESVLFQPDRGVRGYGEFNDSGANMADSPMVVEGPDLFAKIAVPAGTHRVSFYFYNVDAHVSRNAYNDYFVQVKSPAGSSPDSPTPAVGTPPVDDGGANPDDQQSGRRGSTSIDAELTPTIARLRVPNFWEGVYKRMLLKGPATYWIKIGRNHSYTTKVEAIFADSEGPGPAVIKVGRLPALPVPAPKSDPTTMPSPIGQAARLWAALDAALDKQGYADCSVRMRLAAYSAAQAAGADPGLLANWRWRLPLWTETDHQKMDVLFKGASLAN